MNNKPLGIALMSLGVIFFIILSVSLIKTFIDNRAKEKVKVTQEMLEKEYVCNKGEICLIPCLQGQTKIMYAGKLGNSDFALNTYPGVMYYSAFDEVIWIPHYDKYTDEIIVYGYELIGLYPSSIKLKAY